MATYYTSSTATGGGDGSINNEWTLEEAADNASDGDIVLIKADGTYALASSVRFDTVATSVVNPPIFRGAAADGTDDGTTATISGSGGSTVIFSFDIAGSSYKFKNLRLTSSSYGVYLSNVEHVIFEDCRFDNQLYGLYVLDSSGHAGVAYNCQFDNCTNGGYYVTGIPRGRWQFDGCLFFDNAIAITDSVSATGAREPAYRNCIFYNNSSYGIYLIANSGAIQPTIEGCTFYNNGYDAVNIDADIGGIILRNNIFANNAGYGVSMNGGSANRFLICENNCSYGNTSGAISINGGVFPGTGHVYEDPQFVSVVSGSEDFTPQNTNMQVQNSLPGLLTENYRWIGAINIRAVTDLPALSSVLTTDTLDGVAGTFDESARNTDPGVGNVRLDTDYIIRGVDLTGTLPIVDGSPDAPTLSSVTAGDETLTLSVAPATGYESTPINAYVFALGSAAEISTETITGSGDLVLTGLTNGTFYGVAAVHVAGDVVGSISQVEYASPTDGSASQVELICEAIAAQITTAGLVDSGGDPITANYEMPPQFGGTTAEIMVFPDTASLTATHTGANRANYEINIAICERTTTDAARTNAFRNREIIQDMLVGSRLYNMSAVYVMAEKSGDILSVDELHAKKRFISILTIECERLRART